MAGPRAAQRTSYKEADSDDDWLAGAEEGATKVFEALPLVKGAKGKAGGAKGRKRVGDTYGAGPRKKARKSKGKGKSQAQEDEDESLFSLDLLFRLPNDLFLEICGYLDGRDLFEFSRTCKTMRKTLFSPNSSYIWANSRRRDDIPLPTGMTELELAALLYSNGCQICGKTTFYFRRQIELRFRSVIDDDMIRKTWPDLHPQAKFCVTSHNSEYLVAELAQVNSQLLDLEEEDELATFSAQTASTRGRRAKPGASSVTPRSLVDEFVAQEKVEVAMKLEQETSALKEAVDRKFQRWSEEYSEAEEAKEKAIEAIGKELKDHHGWTTAQVSRYESYAEWRYTPGSKNPAPTEPPAVDNAGWLAFRDRLQSEIDEEAAEQERNETHRRHVNALTPFYHAYCRDSPRPKAFLPTSWCLAGLPAFKGWLGKDDPLFDDELWADRLPLIEAALDDYADGVRVKAIRKILSVTAGVQLETLSTKREDYPRSKYDDGFFRKPTSLVSVAAQGFSYYRVRQTRLVPFPECMEGRGEGDTHYSLAYGIDKRQVYFIRMILDVAGLDEATATTDDLDNLGTRFRWTNAESAQRREKAYTWTDLVLTLKRSGPSLQQLKTGDIPEIELVPAEDADGEDSLGKEREPGGDDAFDNDSGSNSDSDDGADNEPEIGRRRRQVDSSDEETDAADQDDDAEENEEDG
ncbi:hypothetical protein NBRC10513v2_006456 [Rhodotorula toruloides]